ncbi:MAG: DNA recombination protein RmuC [Patescibacteria group bacterium]
MDTLPFIIITIGFLMVIGFLVWSLVRKGADSVVSQNLLQELARLREEFQRSTTEQRQEVQLKLDRVNDQLNTGLDRSHKTIQVQFEQTSRIIQEVTTKLTTLDATNKQVLDFSSQLRSLQDILKNPKHRGILGEYYLETLLKNALAPESYQMQYRLGKDDEGKDLIPDAVVFVKEKIIPVDSKFSLENYNRISEEPDAAERNKLEKTFVNDLKNRILETSKYIQPDKGTMDFAFMFIPHEAIYYDLLVNKIGGTQDDNENLIQRAASKYHVIIVSPTSFLAYLQTVLQALHALKIEERAQDIIKHVSDLGKHFRAYSEFHAKVGNNLTTVVNQYNFSSNELKKVSKDIVKITNGTSEDVLEIVAIEKPLIE